MPRTPQLGAVAGLILGAVSGYLFFHDPGDAVLGTVLAAGALGVAGAVVGYLLVRDRPARRPR